MMTFGKVSIQILLSSPRSNRFLSPPTPTVQMGSEETQPTLSVHEEIPATSADEPAAADPQTAPIEEQEIP